jgi:hypothetical protein
MNKKKLLLISIVACVVLVSVVLIMFFRGKSTRLLELTIYDDLALAKTYYFTLDERGVLRSYFGTRYGNVFASDRHDKYMEIVRESSRKKLSEEEMANLKLMLIKLEESEATKILDFNGGRPAELLYNNEFYRTLFRTPAGSVRLAELVEELVRLSGVTIDFSR